jgi:hypothetical protein
MYLQLLNFALTGYILLQVITSYNWTPAPWPPFLSASLREGWFSKQCEDLYKIFMCLHVNNQQAQLNTELLKHFVFVAIFLTPVSLCNPPLTGDRWILSMKSILGASSTAFGRVNAYCMPQIDNGLIYMRDL